MKKLFSIIFVIGLLWCNVSVAETIESFKCTPKKTDNQEQAKKDLSFGLIYSKDENYKFMTSDLKNIVTLVSVLNKSTLKQYKHYKSMHLWVTYEYNDFFPETYTVSQYVMTENKKNGDIVLAASVVDTSEKYFNEFSKLDELKNKNLGNEDKFIKTSTDVSEKIYAYFSGRWSTTYNIKKARLAWNCNKK